MDYLILKLLWMLFSLIHAIFANENKIFNEVLSKYLEPIDETWNGKVMIEECVNKKAQWFPTQVEAQAWTEDNLQESSNITV